MSSRTVLADYLHTDRNNLVAVTNATTGANIVARSLKLREGDEVLSTDHECGAMDRTWRFVCEKASARCINHVDVECQTPYNQVCGHPMWQRPSSSAPVI